MLFLMATWKWFYYAPNTYKELVIKEMRRKGEVTRRPQSQPNVTVDDASSFSPNAPTREPSAEFFKHADSDTHTHTP